MIDISKLSPEAIENELARLKRYDEELSAVMPKDFKDWWQNSKGEWSIVARGVIESLREREELAWQPLSVPFLILQIL